MKQTILTSAITALVVSGIILGIGNERLIANDNDTSQPSTIDVKNTEIIDSVVEAVDRAEPAVVSVIVTKDLPIIEEYYVDPFGGNSPFEFRIPQQRQNGTEEREIGGGTAFFISSDGLLMTNRHVVLDEDAEYTVLLNDGTRKDAEVVARDTGNDIALLRVEGTGYPSLSFSDQEIDLGQSVIAIGNALGEFRNTVSVGVVSGLSRSITAGTPQTGTVERLRNVMQTDAAINQGNSGGPLLNIAGQVIGMNTAVAAGAQNLGFAIPASDLITAVQSFNEFGRIVRPFLGVRYMQITPALAEEKDLPVEYGALIISGETPEDVAIVPDSPADIAGIQENDIITEIDGEKLEDGAVLADIIKAQSPGDEVVLTIIRDGEEISLTVILQEQE